MNIKIVWYLPVILCIGLFSVKSAVAHDWMAPKEAVEMTNPILNDKEAITAGKKLYIANCAYCHGEKVEGLSSTETGLDKDSPNLTKRIATHSDGDFYWKIKNGRGEMPSFAGELEDDAIWKIITYIRSQSEH